MKLFKTLSLAVASAALSAGTSSAAIITIDKSFVTTSVIPDNDSSGLVDTRNVSVNIGTIDVLTVTLETTGGWNGDLYCYLQHDSGFSILLNRPGRTAAQVAGAPSSGMTILLADSASTDIHTGIASSGIATGTYQPDGRAIDPANVLDTSPRTASLASFIGQNPNGNWSLYVADVSPGSQSTITGWTLHITGTSIPEPTGLALSAAALLTLTRRRRP